MPAPKYNATPRTHIPSTIRPAAQKKSPLTPRPAPGWLIVVSSIAPGLAFIGGLLAGRMS